MFCNNKKEIKINTFLNVKSRKRLDPWFIKVFYCAFSVEIAANEIPTSGHFPLQEKHKGVII